MAIVSKKQITTPYDGLIELWEWSGLGNGDTGEPVNMPAFADRSIQVAGTFGVGGTIIVQGSNRMESETPVYAALTDPQGGAISFAAAGIEQVLESSYLIRPSVTAGDGATSITVRLLIRK